jgi:hypothetical protein
MRTRTAFTVVATLVLASLAFGIHSASAQSTPPVPTGGGSSCRLAGTGEAGMGPATAADYSLRARWGIFLAVYRATILLNRPWFLTAPGGLPARSAVTRRSVR